MQDDRGALLGAGQRMPTSLPADFLNRLIARVPKQSQLNSRLPSAQRICGRRLAILRLHRDLPIQLLANMADTTPSAISQIEWGLADLDGMTPASAHKLGRLLADTPADIPWVESMIAIARGDEAALDDRVVERAIAELEALEPPIKIGASVLVSVVREEVVPGPEQAARPFELAEFQKNPYLFKLLSIFVDNIASGEVAEFDLWNAAQRDMPGPNTTELGELLQSLHDFGLVQRQASRPNPEPDEEPLEYYALTDAGRVAFLRELEKRRDAPREPIPGLPNLQPGSST